MVVGYFEAMHLLFPLSSSFPLSDAALYIASRRAHVNVLREAGYVPE